MLGILLALCVAQGESLGTVDASPNDDCDHIQRPLTSQHGTKFVRRVGEVHLVSTLSLPLPVQSCLVVTSLGVAICEGGDVGVMVGAGQGVLRTKAESAEPSF